MISTQIKEFWVIDGVKHFVWSITTHPNGKIIAKCENANVEIKNNTVVEL